MMVAEVKGARAILTKKTRVVILGNELIFAGNRDNFADKVICY
jgi:hypothetical protein